MQFYNTDNTAPFSSFHDQKCATLSNRLSSRSHLAMWTELAVYFSRSVDKQPWKNCFFHVVHRSSSVTPATNNKIGNCRDANKTWQPDKKNEWNLQTPRTNYQSLLRKIARGKNCALNEITATLNIPINDHWPFHSAFLFLPKKTLSASTDQRSMPLLFSEVSCMRKSLLINPIYDREMMLEYFFRNEEFRQKLNLNTRQNHRRHCF